MSERQQVSALLQKVLLVVYGSFVYKRITFGFDQQLPCLFTFTLNALYLQTGKTQRVLSVCLRLKGLPICDQCSHFLLSENSETPLKTHKTNYFVFRGYKMGSLARNGLISVFKVTLNNLKVIKTCGLCDVIQIRQPAFLKQWKGISFVLFADCS